MPDVSRPGRARADGPARDQPKAGRAPTARPGRLTRAGGCHDGPVQRAPTGRPPRRSTGSGPDPRSSRMARARSGPTRGGRLARDAAIAGPPAPATSPGPTRSSSRTAPPTGGPSTATTPGLRLRQPQADHLLQLEDRAVESDPGFSKIERFSLVQPMDVHAGVMPPVALNIQAGPWDAKGRRLFRYVNARQQAGRDAAGDQRADPVHDPLPGDRRVLGRPGLDQPGPPAGGPGPARQGRPEEPGRAAQGRPLADPGRVVPRGQRRARRPGARLPRPQGERRRHPQVGRSSWRPATP